MTTSSTEVVLPRDPFPALSELLLPQAGGERSALDELRDRARAEGWQAGFESGHADGVAAGIVDARDAPSTQAAIVLGQIESGVQAALAEQATVVASLGAAIVDAALDLARAVVGHEVAASASPGRDALLRAFTEAPTTGSLVAHLHPDDVELLGGDLPAHGVAEVAVVPDATVERGGCIVETSSGRIDALLSTALARAAAALGATEVDEA